MNIRAAIIVATALMSAGCVSAPRGPAASLAEMGMRTSTALGSGIRSTADDVSNVGISNAFAATWRLCNVNPSLCQPTQADAANFAARQKLASAINLRAQAVNALEEAYGALDQEASYDAKGDLQAAVGDAVSAVNKYSDFVLAAPGGQILGNEAGRIASEVAGLLAERRQKKRLLEASRVIQTSAAKLHDGLKAEAAIYESIQGYIVDNQTDARIALFETGLVSRSQFLAPMSRDLGVDLLNDADRTLDSSPAAQTAVVAVIRAEAQAEAERVRTRYQASVAALNALVDAHKSFEQEQSVSTERVTRVLAELDAIIDDPRAD